MLTRLWQCEDPATWQVLLGAPTTLTGLLMLAACWLLLSGSATGVGVARVVATIWLYLVGATAALVLGGIAVGLWLRSNGLDPSQAYDAAKWAVVGVGWPIILATVVAALRHTSIGDHTSAARREPRPIRQALGLLVLLLAPLWIAVSYSSLLPLRTLRDWAAWPVDTLGVALATNECLAEQILQRAGEAGSNPFAVVPDIELLVVRRRFSHREAGWRALASYREKVRLGRVVEPKTLDGVLCRHFPEPRRELIAWANDQTQTPAMRLLARAAAAERQPAQLDPACR